jgi:peptidoglycan/xylan/chitin deacetylase (PgdA/CDA1 family)
MPFWRQLLLNLYYYASCPPRAARNARWRAARQSPVIVLFYHRIADHTPNDWTISCRAFAKQVRWLRRHFDLVSLADAQQRIRSGLNDRPAVSITFDDGYAENFQRALPLLLDQGIPFTYFVTTHHVLTGAPFWHDVARRQPLAPNTIDQIRELAMAGVEIGAHTRTHPDLGRIRDSARLYDEVAGAKHELEAAIGTNVRYFAFPFGQVVNLNAEVFHLARSAGYEGVCSAYGGYNFPGDDAFHLQRIHADGEMVRFKNWLTVDSRKLNSVQRYDYGGSEPAESVDSGKVLA